MSRNIFNIVIGKEEERLDRSTEPRASGNGPPPRHSHIEGEKAPRRKKRIKIIIVAVLCAIIAAVMVWPMVSDLFLPPSQRFIVVADDLGPGWSTTKPRNMNDRILEAADSATVQLGFENSSSYIDGRCTLMIYSTRELADAAYQSGLDNIQYGVPQNITIGDRAAYIQSSNNDSSNVHQLMVMQKGEYIVWFSLTIHNNLPGIADVTPLMALSEAQLKKLP